MNFPLINWLEKKKNTITKLQKVRLRTQNGTSGGQMTVTVQ